MECSSKGEGLTCLADREGWRVHTSEGAGSMSTLAKDANTLVLWGTTSRSGSRSGRWLMSLGIMS